MARIIKVGPHTVTPNKAANPFKTSRTSTTNPFKYANFEGNTLQFADVFEGFEPKQTNKLKMIASSVAGTMYKARHSKFVETMASFVERIGSGISNTWNYLRNTNVPYTTMGEYKAAWNAATEKVSALKPSFSLSFHGHAKASDNKSDGPSFGQRISSTVEFLQTDITEIGKSVADKWTALVSKYTAPKISSDMPVTELEALLQAELEGAVA